MSDEFIHVWEIWYELFYSECNSAWIWNKTLHSILYEYYLLSVRTFNTIYKEGKIIYEEFKDTLVWDDEIDWIDKLKLIDFLNEETPVKDVVFKICKPGGGRRRYRFDNIFRIIKRCLWCVLLFEVEIARRYIYVDSDYINKKRSSIN